MQVLAWSKHVAFALLSRAVAGSKLCSVHACKQNKESKLLPYEEEDEEGCVCNSKEMMGSVFKMGRHAYTVCW